MALDDILRANIATLGRDTAELSATHRNIQAGEGAEVNKNIVGLVFQYTLPEGMEITQDQLDILNEADPDKLKKEILSNLPLAYNQASRRLSEAVAPHYQEIVSNLEGNELVNILLATPAPKASEKYPEIISEGQDYTEWLKQLEAGNTDFYLKNSHPIIRKIFEGKDEEIIIKYMIQRMEYHQSNYLEPFIKDGRKFNKGREKKDASLINQGIDSDKIREYLVEAIDNTKGDSTRQTYEQLGILYTKQLIEKEKNKQNRADRDSYRQAA